MAGDVASDSLQGRATFSTGQGLAAGYIEHHLREWGVTPGGDPGSFLQTVRVLGVKTTSRSSLTVRVQGETRTFQDGEGVTFPRNMGASQTLMLDRVEFVGYGLAVPAAQHVDFEGKNVRGAAVVFLGNSTPKSVDATTYRRAIGGRARYATEQLHSLNRTANASLPEPLTLNYELNDPADPEQLYFRSDHYSYAARGVPVIFFTTGLHPDYHANTDEVSEIEFVKMTRIVQLIYETGARVANLDHAPRRGNLGPRGGKDTRE